VNRRLGAEHRVLSGDPALVAGAGNEHADPVGVPGGQDVRQVAAQRLIDLNVTALGVDADLGGADQVGIAGPANREEHRVDIDLTRVRVGPVVHGRAPGAVVQPFDMRRGQDRDAAVAKGLGERVGHVVVGVRQ
jgi:hypothetical protein